MKHIIKNYMLKTMYFFGALSIVGKPIPFPWTTKVKCPLSYRQSTSRDHKTVTSPCVLVVNC